MHHSFTLLSTLSLLPFASAVCPLYGPVFPPATNLVNSTIIENALRNLTQAFNAGFTTGDSPHGSVDPSGANAVQIFSLDSAAPLFEYYHDGTTLSNYSGVRKVDGDSIFRIGSISKLVTVYMLLAELGDRHWGTRATEVIPELRNRTKWKENPVDYVKWEDITLGALAGHVAGVTRDLIAFGPLFSQNAVQFGLPPLSPSELPACIFHPTTGNNCDRKEFFEALDSRQPVFPPNTKSSYSNTAFVLLGYALESITGKTYRDILQSALINPLGLTATSFSKPQDSRGVIPFNVTFSDWRRDLGDATAMGGLYASLNDLSTIGRSILNSTLLDASTTRAWMKPTSFTSDLLGGVGRPWEIYRADTLPNRGVIDIFGKGGDIGSYHTFLGLVPDYNVGFVSALGGMGDYGWLNGLIVDIVFPALEATAREQTDAAYAGTYAATNGLNSTLILTTQAGRAGLGVTNWINNGTNFLDVLTALIGTPITSDLLRLYPTNLERKTGNGTEIAWRASVDVEPVIKRHGPFSACPTWFSVDGLAHGDFSLDEILFTLGADGKATSVNMRGFRIDLERQ